MSNSTAFNKPLDDARIFRQRIIVAAVMIVILSGLLIARLSYLQGLQHRYYTTMSRDNSINLVPIQPPRGLIYDRNGVLLAENLPVFSLDIVPDRSEHLKETIEELQKLLDLDDSDVDRFYQQVKQHRTFDEVPLKIKLSQEEVAKFMVNQYQFPEAKITARLIRYYPYGADFVDVIGYTGRINQEELAKLDQSNYAATDYIGKLGIEKYFEDQLHGQTGYRQVEVNAAGREVRTLTNISAKAGVDIYLSIDSALQEMVVKAMSDYRGSVVVIDPRTGQVLAMVSSPGYDPNLFVQGIDNKTYQTLRNSPDQPLFNRTIRGQYPAGSTIKPFFALAAANGNIVDPNYKIFDPGFFQINKHSRKYRNWRPEGEGWINMRSAIARSCDTYFYWLSLKMGITLITNTMQAFGFGQYTGIEMDEELKGLVPSPTVKRGLTGKPWFDGDTLNTSIGQGFTLVTPLQLAVATSIIANRGIHFQPTLVYKTQAEGQAIVENPPIEKAPVVLRQSAWDTVIQGMVDVIASANGTGYRFGDPAYTVAAKTGTAQLFDVADNQKYVASQVQARLRDNSMFIAFAPVKNPKIVVAVAIQNEAYAASVARKVMDYYLINEKHLFDSDTPAPSSAATVTQPPPASK